MKKLFLLIVVFALFSTLEAKPSFRKLPYEDESYCKFVITSVSTPTQQITKTLTLENYEYKVENLAPLGFDNNIASIQYSGNHCFCSIQLWSNAGYSGDNIKYIVNQPGIINLTKYWKKNVSSYSINC